MVSLCVLCRVVATCIVCHHALAHTHDSHNHINDPQHDDHFHSDINSSLSDHKQKAFQVNDIVNYIHNVESFSSHSSPWSTNQTEMCRYNGTHLDAGDPCPSACNLIIQTFHLNSDEEIQNLQISQQVFRTKLLPKISRRLTECSSAAHRHHHRGEAAPSSKIIWLYAIASVIFISIGGLMVVSIVPRLQRYAIYNPTIQLLVGLAVGSLTGDAFLHLLPHAFNAHDHEHSEKDHSETEGVFYGFIALCGVLSLLLLERGLHVFKSISRNRKTRLSPQDPDPVIKDEKERTGNAATCSLLPKGDNNECTQKDDVVVVTDNKPTVDIVIPGTNGTKLQASPSQEKLSQGCTHIERCHKTIAVRHDRSSDIVTVTDHHHHSHYRHSHSYDLTPKALTILLGDGLHNFFDGLAIGAAYGASVATGVSTALAVFCHELPHELGDFAALVNLGVNHNRAIAYNILSSVFCLAGTLLGVALGEASTVIAHWISIFTAGMFIYLALVNMLPQLHVHPPESGKFGCGMFAVQFGGIAFGVCIMLMIALFEHEFHAFLNPSPKNETWTH